MSSSEVNFYSDTNPINMSQTPCLDLTRQGSNKRKIQVTPTCAQGMGKRIRIDISCDSLFDESPKYTLNSSDFGEVSVVEEPFSSENSFNNVAGLSGELPNCTIDLVQSVSNKDAINSKNFKDEPTTESDQLSEKENYHLSKQNDSIPLQENPKDHSASRTFQSVDHNLQASKFPESFSGDHKQIFETLHHLNTSLVRIEGKLDTLLGKVTEPSDVSPVFERESTEAFFFGSLPLTTEEKVQELEEKLHVKSFKAELVRVLMTVGGTNCKNLTCNILRKLFTDEVAECYSMTGKPIKNKTPKKAFEKTHLYNLVQEICFKCVKDTKVTIIRETITDWLQQSKFRRVRRAERATLRQSGNEENSPAPCI